jgi:Kef-type K+ transport system membrane component KefB
VAANNNKQDTMSRVDLVYSLCLIFTGAALLATFALFARQAMLIAYIFLGVILGPWGLELVSDSKWIADAAEIGIMFLLYLLGLDLLPQKLWRMLGEALGVTLISCIGFLLLGLVSGLVFGFTLRESLFIGSVLMFSSTIIGLKLIPTTALHHRHTGQVIISVLLLQDLIAIIILLLLQGYGKGGNIAIDIGLQLLSLPVLVLIVFVFERYMLKKLIARFDQIHEYIFLLAIGWCLGIAELANFLGLSHEIGAFIAGVTLAASPISLFIAERLKPLRDFFLILFFFSLGASFNLDVLMDVFFPAAALATLIMVIKPYVFRLLLVLAGETRKLSMEIGVRLGQMSEFALLICVVAVKSSFVTVEVSYLIQMATLLSFIVSSYLVVMRYPTPIAVSDRLRRD